MLIVMVASRSLLRMEQIPGKGRGLVASQLLKAGQIVLTESPSFSTQLLLSSHPLLHLTLTMTIVLESYLSLTIVLLSRALLAQTTVFVPWSASPLHSNPHTLLGYANHSTTPQFNTSSTTLQERQVQAHLIVASHNLFLHNHTPSKLHTFLYLHGTPDDAILDAANFLHSLISPLFPPQAQLSVDLIAQLLAKDRLNSFGLMDPYSCNGPQRSIKAYAIYPKATFFNHDCVPNASRFEYVDSTNDDYGHNSTDMLLGWLRMLMRGKRFCISYFRIGRDYCTRKGSWWRIMGLLVDVIGARLKLIGMVKKTTVTFHTCNFLASMFVRGINILKTPFLNFKSITIQQLTIFIFP